MNELTLEQYINELPDISLAQKEYSELKQKVYKLEEELSDARSELVHLELIITDTEF